MTAPAQTSPERAAAEDSGCDARDTLTNAVALPGTLFRTPGFTIGRFRCPPDDARWRTENQIYGGHHVVLPGTSVRIAQAGRRPVVANRNHAMFYNDGQVYKRGLISEQGDQCIFFVVDPAMLAAMASDMDPSLADRLDAPFPFDQGPCDPRSYLLHHRLVQRVSQGPVDLLWVEEALVHLVRALLVRTYRFAAPQRIRAARETTSAAHAESVEAVKQLLSSRFREPLSLSALARAAGLSMYHLARIFKQRTGLTLHAYQDQLRVRTSLQEIARAGSDLTGLALDLGYSSHSHFTDAFRRVFGAPPRSIRRAASAADLVQMSKMLEV